MIPQWSFLLGDGMTTVSYEFARLQSLTEWWHWLLLLVGTCAVLAYIIGMYLYDSVELSMGLTIVLTLLRIAAFAGILFYFMDLEKRTQRKLVNNSRALLLIDTSQSMGLQDNDSTSVPAGPSRIQHVIAELSEGQLVSELRARHDVLVYRFDQASRPTQVASYPKLPPADEADPEMRLSEQNRQALWEARLTALFAAGVLGLAVIGGLVYLLSRTVTASDHTSWSLLVSMVALIAAVVIFAVANLRHPDIGLAAIAGLQEPDFSEQTISTSDDQTADPEVDWAAELLPRGGETRIGDAVRFLVNKERGGPIAGIVLVSDGGSNAGLEYQAAVKSAKAAQIPIFTVGLGSDKRPVNLRVVDLEAPERVYPGDDFALSGYLQAFGLAGRTVTVELVSAPADSDPQDSSVETIEEVRRVRLNDDGEIVSLKPFTVSPKEEGRRQYRLRAVPPEEDRDTRDNQKTANVEVMERRSRILLIAGGPTREYRFLRNMLHRDQDTIVDVYLQSSQPGVAQEADQILFEFPSLQKELFEYDCIVAFDPDWMALDEDQTRLLERWVAQEAGGLFVVAGPVFTPEWTRFRRGREPRADLLRGLYPVVFYSQGAATLDLGRFGGTAAWPLQFTREGEEAEQLWLEDDKLGSEQAWASFEGVYGYYAVKDPKPGARVFARFSDPATAIDGDLPIYLASHFYGAGRVFFQASGEMWRIRAVDDTYFEQYYTKLIRWVSQGRMLRDSKRGVLMVEKDRAVLGDTIPVRAILVDAQLKPLADEQVDAVLVQPDSTRRPIVLRRVKDSPREGTYAGQFTALQAGDYVVELVPPQAPGDDLLSREVRVLVPRLEIQKPERNDALLKDVAEKTGGAYYVGLQTLNNAGVGRTPLTRLLAPQDQETYLPGTPDKRFDRVLMTWLMVLICGVLCLEWLFRRLSKLA